MIVVNALFILIAFLGLFSFLGAVKEKKNRVAKIYHKFDPLRKLGLRYPKAFGLPIFIVGMAIPFPLTSFFVDILVAIFFGAVAYAWFQYTNIVAGKDTSAEK